MTVVQAVRNRVNERKKSRIRFEVTEWLALVVIMGGVRIVAERLFCLGGRSSLQLGGHGWVVLARVLIPDTAYAVRKPALSFAVLNSEWWILFLNRPALPRDCGRKGLTGSRAFRHKSSLAMKVVTG